MKRIAESVIALFGVLSQEESIINNGYNILLTLSVVDEQVEDYMESLKRIKEAIDKLQDLKYAACDASIIGLVISNV
jgi:hypothetical protein